MLKFNLSRILTMRGIDKPFAFLVKRGFYRTVASGLINNRVQIIKLSHLETLCRALNCTPNDLFEWQPKENDALGANHPLNTLIREKSAADFVRMYKEIPLDKLDKVEEFIAQLKKE